MPRVEGNNFIHNATGVRFNPDGATAAGNDLGGGGQGSQKLNNFRSFKSGATSFAGAMVTCATGGPTTFLEMGILFGTANPRASVHNKEDTSALASVTTTNSVVGLAAFVESLFLMVHRESATLPAQLTQGVESTYSPPAHNPSSCPRELPARAWPWAMSPMTSASPLPRGRRKRPGCGNER